MTKATPQEKHSKLHLIDVIVISLFSSLSMYIFYVDYKYSPGHFFGNFGFPHTTHLIHSLEKSIAVWSISLMVLKLIRSRTSLRHHLIQTGTAALMAIACCLCYGLVFGLVAISIGGRAWWDTAFSSCWSSFGPAIGAPGRFHCSIGVAGRPIGWNGWLDHWNHVADMLFFANISRTVVSG